MNTHQPAGHRSGHGSAGLWSLISEDDKRKNPSADEAMRKTIAGAQHQLHGDVLRPRKRRGK